MSESFLEELSTRGSMGLSEFRIAFDELIRQHYRNEDYGDLTDAGNRFVRFMDALGHCEFDFDIGRVYTCPPNLARLPMTLPWAVLTGARTPALIKKLRNFVKMHKNEMTVIPRNQDHSRSFVGRENTTRLLLPQCIIVGARRMACLEQLASELGTFEEQINNSLGAPAAWALADFSASLEDVDKGLLFEESSERNWPITRVFNPEHLVFEVPSGQSPEKGLRCYIDPTSKQSRYIFKDGFCEAVIDRDWGRYLALAEDERYVLYYDERRQQLIVPQSVPLPKILARATTMCSGLVPWPRQVVLDIDYGQQGRFSADLERFNVDVYNAVPYKLAETLAKKLAQPLQPYYLMRQDRSSSKLFPEAPPF